MQKIKI